VQGGADPFAQSFTVSNGGGGDLAIPSVAIAYAAGSDWLSATVSGDRPPFTVSVQPTVGTLPVGTYAATVLVRSNGASNTPQSVTVALAVSEKVVGPSIGLSTSAASFTTRSHGPDPIARTIAVTNGGAGTLSRPTLQVTYEGAVTGWLSAGVSGDSAPYTITLQPLIADLGAGTHRAIISVESAGAANTPSAISVTLTLTPTWTVFVYANADNALSTALLSALAEMSEASLGENVTVVVAADWSAGRALPGGDPFPAGTDWFRIRGGGAVPELLAHLDEQDLDDPAIFAAAVESALNVYPADHHAVVLWGPGRGWEGFGGDEQDTPGGASLRAPISAEELALQLRNVLPNVGVTPPIDVVGFDAPLMMGQEVAFAFRDVATTFIATADLDLGPGWDWTGTLSRLAADPFMSAAGFATAEVQAWDAHHAGPADVLGRAHAAVDLTQRAAYADAWSALSTAMLTSAPDWLAIARMQFATAPGYGIGEAPAEDPSPALRDAGQLLDALSSDLAVGDAAIQARAALDALVLGNAVGELRRTRSQAAVHLEAPLGGRPFDPASPYATLEWDAATRWSVVLESISNNDDGQPPEFDRVPENTSAPTLQNPPTLHVTSYEPDVAAARLALAEAGGARSYGVVAEGSLEPNGTRSLVWDGNVATLDDGTTSSAAFVEPWIRGSSGAVFLLPGEISDGASAIEAHAVVVEGEPVVDAVAVRVNGRLLVLSMADFRGLTFTPSFQGGAVALAIPDSPSASLSFSWSSAAAGVYRLTASVTDVWGNVSSATDDVTVTTAFGN
jgi:hypothetical protein